jgi:hypothetical protein
MTTRCRIAVVVLASGRAEPVLTGAEPDAEEPGAEPGAEESDAAGPGEAEEVQAVAPPAPPPQPTIAATTTALPADDPSARIRFPFVNRGRTDGVSASPVHLSSARA